MISTVQNPLLGKRRPATRINSKQLLKEYQTIVKAEAVGQMICAERKARKQEIKTALENRGIKVSGLSVRRL